MKLNPVKYLLKKIAEGSNVHPEVIKALSHYAFGRGKDRKIDPKFVKDILHKELVTDLSVKLLGVGSYASCVSKGRIIDWWTGNGVVGDYNYHVEPVEGGFIAHCWDLWDFNPSGAQLAVKLNPELWSSVFRPLLDLLEVNYVLDLVYDEVILIEDDLTRFNKGHQFYTRWQDFIFWDELEELCRRGEPDDLRGGNRSLSILQAMKDQRIRMIYDKRFILRWVDSLYLNFRRKYPGFTYCIYPTLEQILECQKLAEMGIFVSAEGIKYNLKGECLVSLSGL